MPASIFPNFPGEHAPDPLVLACLHNNNTDYVSMGASSLPKNWLKFAWLM